MRLFAAYYYYLVLVFFAFSFWLIDFSSTSGPKLPQATGHTYYTEVCVFRPDRGYQQGSRFSSGLALHLCVHASVKRISFTCIYLW